MVLTMAILDTMAHTGAETETRYKGAAMDADTVKRNAIVSFVCRVRLLVTMAIIAGSEDIAKNAIQYASMANVWTYKANPDTPESAIPVMLHYALEPIARHFPNLQSN